jgi:hypothetical protein
MTYESNVRQTASLEPDTTVKLYRLRNPLMAHQIDTNPYVVIDTLRLLHNPAQGTGTQQVRTPAGDAFDEKTPSAKISGAYYVGANDGTPDVDSSIVPGWATTEIELSKRLSLQRRQPWQGYREEWRPYANATTHPLYGVLMGKANQHIEGAFLGLPSLADSSAAPPLLNAIQHNGFVPLPPLFAQGTRPAANALERWLAFPFLNRQLATPLELLSVRLYGSHLWFLPGGVQEWRLRFTDDFEFMPYAWKPAGTSNPYFERVWRSRPVPWYEDQRISHPTFSASNTVPSLDATQILDPAPTVGNRPQVQLPMPHLYRFFELVECRSRMNNGVPEHVQTYLDTTTNTLRTMREDRTPGKINLNTVTEEEVFKGLVDSVSAMAFLPAEFNDLMTAYDGVKTSTSIAGTATYAPIQYWSHQFTPLGQAPLGPFTGGDYSGSTMGPLMDVLSRVVPWGSLTFSRMADSTVFTPPEGTISIVDPFASSFPVTYALTGGLDLLMLEAKLFDVPVTASSWSAGHSFAFDVANKTFSPNRQFPGLITGPFLGGTPTYPGTSIDFQVSSEMYRSFLLSRAGADGVHGTADDKPFRSFAAGDVSDTILRSRNAATSGLVHEGTLFYTDPTGGTIATASEKQSAAAVTWIDGLNDVVSVTGDLNLYVGEYIARLGGQYTPRLFDPVPDPYVGRYTMPLSLTMTVDGSAQLWSVAAPVPDLADTMLAGPFVEDDGGVKRVRVPKLETANNLYNKLPADYWMLEDRRNELLAKISGNSTTRSHVFAVWVTVGFFRVEPGTENYKVPLLGSEVNAETGQPTRHRAFFIVDRSQATEYEPDDIDANLDFDQMRRRKILEYMKMIE